MVLANRDATMEQKLSAVAAEGVAEPRSGVLPFKMLLISGKRLP